MLKDKSITNNYKYKRYVNGYTIKKDVNCDINYLKYVEGHVNIEFLYPIEVKLLSA